MTSAESAALLDQAVARHQAQDLAGAEALYRRVLDVDPGNLAARVNLGIMELGRGHAAAAVAAADAALGYDDAHARAWNLKGLALTLGGDPRAALACYERALVCDPPSTEAPANRAAALLDLDDALGAAEACRAVLRTRDDAACQCILGLALFKLDRPEDAIGAFNAALRLAPGMAEAHNGLANVLRRSGRVAEAILGYTQAIACDPGSADAYNNRAVAWQYLRRIPESLADYDAALARAPGHAGAHWNRALVRLLTGDYARGWPDYEWRWRSAMRPHARTFSVPQWRGENIAGKTILIHAEQGLGDVLQFCRYVPLAAARGARVVLEAHRPLRRLLAGLEGAAAVITSDETPPPLDVHCPMLSLPLAFGTTVETIPAAVPYLARDPVLAAAWRAKLGPRRRPRVGVVWAGRPDNHNDINRSMPVETLAPWLAEDVEIHCLQKQVSASDRAWAGARGVIFHDQHLGDFADTAALAASMDAVISVCTSVAHLAGALGLRTWVALCFAADWRWLLDRTDSPWYPTARLFRQPAPGDWPAVAEQIAAAVRQLK